MNWNGNETESFAGNFVASGKKRLFFEVPLSDKAAADGYTILMAMDLTLAMDQTTAICPMIRSTILRLSHGGFDAGLANRKLQRLPAKPDP